MGEAGKDETGGYELDVGIAEEFEAFVGDIYSFWWVAIERAWMGERDFSERRVSDDG